ncbi:MAG: hypothetical protein V1494_07740 [Candidatus Diapherotrites archaeon]
MVNVTFSVPERVHEIMKRHREIRWTELARKPVIEFAERIEKQSDCDIVEILRMDRMAEQDSLMKKAKGNPEKALKLWAGELKKRRKKAKLPDWWNSAASPL